jgi:hypothetical protein
MICILYIQSYMGSKIRHGDERLSDRQLFVELLQRLGTLDTCNFDARFNVGLQHVEAVVCVEPRFRRSERRRQPMIVHHVIEYLFLVFLELRDEGALVEGGGWQQHVVKPGQDSLSPRSARVSFAFFF